MSKQRRKREPIAAQSQATQRPAGAQPGNQNAAKAAQAVAAQSQATQKPKGEAKTNDDNESGVTINRTGSRNDTTYAERRLRKDRPDLYALCRLLRDRKPCGGWVRLGKYTRLKGTAYA
jgi:hypothetical protein